MADPSNLALQVRDEAARLVRRHAARLGMDQFAADLLLDAIRKIPVVEQDPNGTGWIYVNGEKPKLPDYAFVIARYHGDSREEAEAYRQGYGEPVDAVRWAHVAEYRRKSPAPLDPKRGVL